MKRLLLFFFLFCFLLTSQGLASDSSFPHRNVLVTSVYDVHQNTSVSLRQLFDRNVADIFKFPHYELSRATIAPTLSQSSLESLATNTGSDIVVVPVIDAWEYRSLNRISFHFYHLDDEIYTRAYLKLSLYTYNSNTGKYTIYSTTYSNYGDSLDVPNPYSVFQTTIDRLLKKFPYKRIPTDLILPKAVETPMLMPTVDSPYPLPEGIQVL